MKKIYKVLAAAGAVGAVAYTAGVAFLTYKTFVSPPEPEREEPKAGKFYDDDIADAAKETNEAIAALEEKYTPEEVYIYTDDGLTLPGYFYINENGSKNTIMCVHGYNTNSDFAFATMVEPILSRGYNCFLVNHRHFNGNEGKFTGFGILEKNELIKWIELVNSYFPDGKIILYGTSMGAATIMQASDQDLTENVVGFIEDCGFTTCYDEFRFLTKSVLHIPSKPIADGVNVLTKAFLDIDIKTSDSREALKNTSLPALFIHGGRDNFVPTYMVEECFEACASEDKQLIIYDSARHVHSHFKYKEQYEKDIFDFAERIFNKE
ncbi:MAG: alpha/beta hydrolase [Eubacterium sp.]|nr:alpha/beta hydrolase [Eubacterium sp.]